MTELSRATPEDMDSPVIGKLLSGSTGERKLAAYEFAQAVHDNLPLFQPKHEARRPMFLHPNRLGGYRQARRALREMDPSAVQRMLEKNGPNDDEVDLIDAHQILAFQREVTAEEAENEGKIKALMYAVRVYRRLNPEGDEGKIKTILSALHQWYRVRGVPTHKQAESYGYPSVQVHCREIARYASRNFDALPPEWRDGGEE